MKLLILFACSSLALSPVFAQEAPLSGAPKLQWGLRLTQGQTWTQTVVTHAHSVQQLPVPHGGGKPSTLELNIGQTIGFKNEVVEVAPTYYLVRLTYTQSKTDTSFKIDRKSPPMPAKSQPPVDDLVGVSFLIKQAPDGRVLDVTGLEEFLARQKKIMGDLGKEPFVGAALRDLLPSDDSFKKTIAQSQSLSLSRKPLSVGESYSYSTNVSVLKPLSFSIKGQRTLLSFDDKNALIAEGGTFSFPPALMFGATKQKTPPSGYTTKMKVVLLTGDAAKLYYVARYLRAKSGAQPTYLSKNGRVYYREAGKPQHVIWLDPPTGNVAIPESEGARYRDIKGFNNQTKGLSLSDFYNGNANIDRLLAAPTPTIQLPKVFVTMNGTISGKSTVDVATGLTSKSDLMQTLIGKMTLLTPDGHKQSVPLTATSRTISSIQMN